MNTAYLQIFISFQKKNSQKAKGDVRDIYSDKDRIPHHICIYVCVHVYMCVSIHTYVCACVRACVCELCQHCQKKKLCQSHFV